MYIEKLMRRISFLNKGKYLGQKLVYFLNFKTPGVNSGRIPIIKKLTIGSSSDVEVIIDDLNLAPNHGVFRVHNDVLSLYNLGGNDHSFIGKQPLIHGKMYILDSGDELSLGGLDLIVSTEAIKDEESYQQAIAVFDKSKGKDEDEDEDEDEGEGEGEGKEKHKNKDEDKEILEMTLGPGLNDKKKGHRTLPFSKENLFQKIVKKIKKIKGYFKKKTLADDNMDFDMSMPSGLDNPSQRDILLAQKNKNRPMASKMDFTKNKKNRKKNKSRSSSSLIGARTGHRLLSLILNLILFQSLYYIYIPNWKLNLYFDKITKVVIKYLDQGIKEISAHVPQDYQEYLNFLDYLNYLKDEKVIIIIITYLSMQALFTLLLGVNLGQFLVAINSQGHFLIKRLKGFFRSILEPLTFPFLIFDLPALFGKRTLKELLTFSQLGHKSNRSKWLGAFVFFPFFFVILLLSPFFKNSSLIPLRNIDYKEFKQVDIKKPFYLAHSQLLNLKLKAKDLEGFTFIPHLKYKNKQLNYELILSDDRQKEMASFEIVPLNINHYDLARKGLEGNLVAGLTYPNLSAEKNSSFAPASELELEQLISHSFKVSPYGFYKLISSNGPFLIGLAKTRQFILGHIATSSPKKVTFIKKENHTLTSLSSEKSLSIIFLLSQEGPLILEFPIKNRNEKVRKKLYDIILKSSHIPKSSRELKKALEKKLKNQKGWNAFDVVDFYAHISSSQKKINQVLISKYLSYMRILGKKILFSNNQKLLKEYIKILQSTKSSMIKSRSPSLIILKQSLTSQISALKIKDKEYFENWPKLN